MRKVLSRLTRSVFSAERYGLWRGLRFALALTVVFVLVAAVVRWVAAQLGANDRWAVRAEFGVAGGVVVLLVSGGLLLGPASR